MASPIKMVTIVSLELFFNSAALVHPPWSGVAELMAIGERTCKAINTPNRDNLKEVAKHHCLVRDSNPNPNVRESLTTTLRG